MNQGGTERVFEQNLPTAWYAVRMTPLYNCDVDSAYIAFGITKNSAAFVSDSIEVRILNNTLPTITILDHFKANIPTDAFGSIPDSYWIIELDFDNNTARFAPPHDFWLAWRLVGSSADVGRIRLKKPAANPNRSVVINANGTTTPVYQYVIPTITDTVDLWAETRVCYYNGIPVELSSFSAQYDLNRTLLRWETASETNNLGFDVERAIARSDAGMLTLWQRIGFVPGQGTTTDTRSYRFVDTDPGPGINEHGVLRYRLRQVDYDGRFTHSPIAETHVPFSAGGIELNQNYPNPVSRGELSTVTFSTDSPAHIAIELTDALGRSIARLTESDYDRGTHTLVLPLSTLSRGSYQYTLTSGSLRLSRRFTIIND